MDEQVQLRTFLDHLKAGRKQEADAILQAVLSASPERAAPYALLIGGMLAQNGQYSEAVPLYEEAIRLSPDDAPAYFYLGVAYHALERDADSDRIWDELSARFPNHPTAYYQAALRSLKQNEYAQAKSSLEEAIERFPADHPLRNDALQTLALIERQMAG